MTVRPARFHNTLGRRLVPLAPLVAGRIGLYTCGPTVYNHVHIGNLRTFLFEDLLKRALRLFGYRVEHVMNLTDIDDKTIRGAEERGVTLDEFTAPYVESFFADLATLGVDPADHYPRATAHVAEMQEIIGKLLARGHAYLSDGSVWFRIASDDDYGKLSGVDLEQARQGERVASDEYEKEDLRDFVLWKGAKPGEPAWESPWGPGRPGWHIECSAMSAKYLGETFDIHCGGVDNVFPHHENEIAQSECATGKPFVELWLHSEHLIVDGEKMSKSLGNQYTLPDLLARGLSPRGIRHALVSVHYRQKLNFTLDGVRAAERALARVDEMRFRLRHAAPREADNEELALAIAESRETFAAALADDLNVSGALAAAFDLVRAANIAIDRGFSGRDKDAIEGLVVEFDSVFGTVIGEKWPAHTQIIQTASIPSGSKFFPPSIQVVPAESQSPASEVIESLVNARNQARARREFADADRIRDQLAAQGIVLEDTPHGTRWKRAR